MEQWLNFITNHSYLWVGALAIVILLLLLEFEAKWRGFRRLDASEVSLQMNRGAIVVDINEASDFAQGHILGAINIPFSQWEKKVNELNIHKPALIILVAHQERQALHAATLLKREGFDKIGFLAGGLATWRGAGLPLVRK